MLATGGDTLSSLGGKCCPVAEKPPRRPMRRRTGGARRRHCARSSARGSGSRRTTTCSRRCSRGRRRRRRVTRSASRGRRARGRGGACIGRWKMPRRASGAPPLHSLILSCLRTLPFRWCLAALVRCGRNAHPNEIHPPPPALPAAEGLRGAWSRGVLRRPGGRRVPRGGRGGLRAARPGAVRPPRAPPLGRLGAGRARRRARPGQLHRGGDARPALAALRAPAGGGGGIACLQRVNSHRVSYVRLRSRPPLL